MKQIIYIIIIGAILYVSLLGLRGLCEPDEGRYAEIAREMLEQNNYTEPHLNYIKHFHKPPLAYWLVAISYLFFGMNEFTARLPVALIAISGLVITFFMVLAMGRDKKNAFLCSLVLATSLQYFVWSQVLAADMIFSFFIYLALFGFFKWYTGKEKNIYLFYLGISCAFMVKGPVAIIITFLIIVIFAALTRSWNLFKRMKLLKGMILFFALVSPWFIYVCIKNPGLLEYFVFDQSVNRLLTTAHGREGNILYFIPVLIVGFLPWIVFLPGLIKKYKPWRRENNSFLFLFLWIIVPILFFSISSSKLPGYILPIYPALAILTGNYLYDRNYIKSFIVIFVVAVVVYMSSVAFLPLLEEKLGENLSIRKIAEYINKNRLAEEKIVNYRCFFQGLSFYLKERVILVEKGREVQFEDKIDIHKDYMFSDIQDFWQQTKRDKRVWLFCPVKDYEDLAQNSPVPLYEIWKEGRYMLVSNEK